MQTNSGKKPFQCAVCMKEFIQKCNLNRHLGMHTNELPFSCLNCQERFFQKVTKQLHENLCNHRRYECCLCQYKCVANGSMKQHMQAKHTDEKLFECDICGKRSIRKEHLHQHSAIHRDQFLFRCIKCRRAFSSEDEKIGHETICRRRQYQCYFCKE